MEEIVSYLGIGDTAPGSGGSAVSCPVAKPFCEMGGELGTYIQQPRPASCGHCGESEDGKRNPLTPDNYRGTAIHYLAHLLGREMYTTLIRDETETENENENADPTTTAAVDRSAQTNNDQRYGRAPAFGTF